MTTMPRPCLLDALFEFHPREGHTPRENFLTEAFAHVLKTDERARCQWLSKLLDTQAKCADITITTRPTERDDRTETSIYPDMRLRGHLAGGKPFDIYCEHKWDSDCNQEQLRKYKNVADRKKARLVFVGATYRQRAEAAECLPANQCFVWEEAFRALDGAAKKSEMLCELLVFMANRGLSPTEPITSAKMRNFSEDQDFMALLKSVAEKMNTTCAWDDIPARYHAKTHVSGMWGTATIQFDTKDWQPSLWLGFLYNTSDHKVAFVAPSRGPDLMLRIAVEPKYAKAAHFALGVLRQKRAALQKVAASVLLFGEKGNGNNYSLLLVRECLADVIRDTQSSTEQLQSIHTRLTNWLEILFRDGLLEKGLRKSSLGAGMK